MAMERPHTAGVPPAGGSLMVMVAAGFMALSWCRWQGMVPDRNLSG